MPTPGDYGLTYFVPGPTTCFVDAGLTPAVVGQAVYQIVSTYGSGTMEQMTLANRPILRQDANGKYYLECASNQWMKSVGTFSQAANQPFTLSVSGTPTALPGNAANIVSFGSAAVVAGEWRGMYRFGGARLFHTAGANPAYTGDYSLNTNKSMIITGDGVGTAAPLWYENNAAIASTGGSAAYSAFGAGTRFFLNIRSNEDAAQVMPFNFYGFGFRLGTGALTLSEVAGLDEFQQGLYAASLGTVDVTRTSRTATTVTLAISTSGWSPAPTNYAWYSDTTYNFSPGPGNLLAGENNPTLTYTPGNRDVRYFRGYASGVAGTNGSPAIAAVPHKGTIKLAAVGSSTFVLDNSGAGLGSIPQRTANQIRDYFVGEYDCTVNNLSVNGTTCNGWWPANRVATLAAWQSAGIQVVLFGWGINDARIDGRTPSQFVADCQQVIDDVKSIGAKLVFLGVQCWTLAGGSNQDYGWQYHAARASLIDNVHVFASRQDDLRFLLTAQTPSLMTDGVHSGATLQSWEADWMSDAAARALGIIVSTKRKKLIDPY